MTCVLYILDLSPATPLREQWDVEDLVDCVLRGDHREDFFVEAEAVCRQDPARWRTMMREKTSDRCFMSMVSDMRSAAMKILRHKATSNKKLKKMRRKRLRLVKEHVFLRLQRPRDKPAVVQKHLEVQQLTRVCKMRKNDFQKSRDKDGWLRWTRPGDDNNHGCRRNIG